MGTRCASVLTPALLTRISIRPYSRTTSFVTACTWASLVTSISIAWAPEEADADISASARSMSV